MGNEKLKRQERLFQKNIYLPKERKAEFEAMAKKEGLKLATWIQSNVGNFSKVEEFVRGQQNSKQDGDEEDYLVSKGKFEAFEAILEFIEALKNKA